MRGANIVSFEEAVRARTGPQPRMVTVEELKLRQGVIPFSQCHAALENVTCVIKTRSRKLTIFHGLTASFPKGRKIVILGHQGSGKSTLFDLLLRRRAPTRGAVHVDSHLSWPVNSADFMEPRLSVHSNVVFAANVLGVSPRRLISSVAQFCELSGKQVHEPIIQLPQFVKKRVGFAVLMAADFDCHLMDGPFRAQQLSLDGPQAMAVEQLMFGRDFIMNVTNPKHIPVMSNLAYILYEGRLYMFPDVEEAARVFDALPVPPNLSMKRDGGGDWDGEADEDRGEAL